MFVARVDSAESESVDMPEPRKVFYSYSHEERRFVTNWNGIVRSRR